MVVSVSVEGASAVVTIDNPPVNATSQAVRQGLLDALAETEADDAVTHVILCCAGRTFVAGADVAEFGASPVAPHLPDVIDAIESASKPWIAALHGTVLGGGLELAMGCHGRVAVASCKLGLPEVTLGLIPGAGGTVRLPRLVPAPKALDMIARGKPITTQAALEAGLIDAVATGDVVDAAKGFAARAQVLPTSDRALRDFDQASYDAAKAKLLSKARGQLSTGEAIAAVDRALTLPPEEARAAERVAFLRLKDSDQSTALRHIFFAERKTLRDPRTKIAPRPLTRIGVIGGGTMGVGIATACLMHGFEVILIEQSAERATIARAAIADTLATGAKRGRVSSADALLSALKMDTTFDALSDADLVIEAVFEDMEVKKQVFAQIEAATDPSAIIATNTSYLDVNEMAATLSDPSRVIGLHFFSPAHIMKLLEIVLPGAVADDVVATASAFAKRLGKIAVLAGVCDGFIGNRIMSAYRHEADFLLMEGALPEEVDAAMREFGFAMGIFEMQDLAGLDISWAMRKRKIAERGVPEGYVHIADRLCDTGRLGRKTQAGWYDYDASGATPSSTVQNIIVAERERNSVIPRRFDSDQIMSRLLERMQTEARAVLSEGIAQSGSDIDVVMVNGYGYPRWRRGLSARIGQTE